MTPNPEQIELLISQLADGTLTPREREAVELALRNEPRWAAAAMDYRRLAELLQRVRAEIGATAAERAVGAADIRALLADEIEFQISQALDGDLNAAAGEQLERTLAAHPELAARRTELARLDGLLNSYASSRPAIDYHALSAAIRRDVLRAAMGADVAREREIGDDTGSAAAGLSISGLSISGSGASGGRSASGVIRPARRRYRWLDGAGLAAVAAALLLSVFVWRSPNDNGGNSIAPAARSVVAVQVITPQSRGLVQVAIDTALPEVSAVAAGELDVDHGIISGGAAQAAEKPVIDTAAVALMF